MCFDFYINFYLNIQTWHESRVKLKIPFSVWGLRPLDPLLFCFLFFRTPLLIFLDQPLKPLVANSPTTVIKRLTLYKLTQLSVDYVFSYYSRTLVAIYL